MIGFLAAGWLCAAPPVSSQDQRRSDEVRAFEAHYLRTVDDGDVKAQLELVSRAPAVSSILDGRVWHGWDAVRSQAEAYVPI